MRLVVSIALLAISLHADVTIRYKTDVQMNSSLPPAITQQATQGMMNGALPTNISMQLKGGKGYSSAGIMTAIVDFTKKEITLLDKEGKRYATVGVNDLADQMMAAMPAMPDQAKAMMAAMKTHFAAKATGATATISGVESEERQLELTIDTPPMPNMPEGPMMRMVMHIWTAKQSEIMKNPAIRELAGYNLYSYSVMNPVGTMEKMFQQMPGFGDAFAGMMKEMKTGGTPAVMRMQMELFMPMIAAMAKNNPQAAAMFGNFDGNSPMLTMTQDVSELSTATVPDSVFQIPDGYKSAPPADILKVVFDKATAAAKAQQAAKPQQ
jgi:hypothetical protein